VDTYVRPADPAPSSLHQLAEGLSAFDSGLGSWLGKRQAEQDKADAIRGAAAFNKANQKGWAQAVQEGLVPANSSPIFMENYKKNEGNLMGVRLREQYNAAYAQWEGRNSDDPEAFQQFLSDFISSRISTDDAEILAGLNPHIEALTESAYTAYSTDRANTIYQSSVNTNSALVGDIIDHASIQGINLETGTDYESLKADILAQREDALGSGIRMAEFDEQLVASIAAKAIEHGDPALLDLLDQTLPGYDVKLSSLPDFRDVKATTIGALEAEARQRMSDADKSKAKEDGLERLRLSAR